VYQIYVVDLEGTGNIRTSEKVLFNMVTCFRNAFVAVLHIFFDFMFIYYKYEFVVVKPSMELYFSFNIHHSENVSHKIIHLNEKYTSWHIPFVCV
jgi:hypothetical protein